MLHHPDARDLVEARLGRELPVVAELDVAAIAESGSRDPLARRLGLRVAERNTEGEDTIATRGVHDEAAPAAAYVEEPLAGREPQLAADEIELRLLRLVQIVGVARKVGARVDHLRVEPERVEGIAD